MQPQGHAVAGHFRPRLPTASVAGWTSTCWLEENGYLKFHDDRRNEQFLAGVDWPRTRAFAVGLSGIFINLAGKFSQGIVTPGEEADRLREEIAAKLTALIDPRTGQSAIKRTYVTSKVYRGPCTRENAPGP